MKGSLRPVFRALFQDNAVGELEKITGVDLGHFRNNDPEQTFPEFTLSGSGKDYSER